MFIGGEQNEIVVEFCCADWLAGRMFSVEEDSVIVVAVEFGHRFHGLANYKYKSFKSPAGVKILDTPAIC